MSDTAKLTDHGVSLGISIARIKTKGALCGPHSIQSQSLPGAVRMQAVYRLREKCAVFDDDP
jgi:hypothetical protein